LEIKLKSPKTENKNGKGLEQKKGEKSLTWPKPDWPAHQRPSAQPV
jgi:hypothetical protein